MSIIYNHKGIELDLSNDIISNKFRQIIRNRDDYEQEEYRLVNKYLNESESDIIELGGGIGFISCVISNIISDDSKHIVIEPTFELIHAIEKNMELNDCKFKILNAAYAPPGESVTLYKRKEAYENSTIQNNNEIIIDEENVRSISLENLIDTYSIEQFILISDIEGQEKELINNEMDMLELYCDMIIIEIHDPVKNKTLKALEESKFNIKERQNNVYVYS